MLVSHMYKSGPAVSFWELLMVKVALSWKARLSPVIGLCCFSIGKKIAGVELRHLRTDLACVLAAHIKKVHVKMEPGGCDGDVSCFTDAAKENKVDDRARTKRRYLCECDC
jgi:hypothetical protein